MGSFSLTINAVDVTDIVCDAVGQKRMSITQNQDGNEATFLLDLTDLGVQPVGARFVATLPGGQTIVLQTITCSSIREVYHDPSLPFWIHQFKCVDPLTAIKNKRLPDRKPFLNTTTGAILQALIAELDPTLTLSLAAGNTVAALNLREFSSFGDVLQSEIMADGYVLRMQGGLNVRGDYDTNMVAQSDWVIDQDDLRYSPYRFRVEPPNELIDSVTVTPNKDIPLARESEFTEIDGRVMPSFALDGKVFGLEDSEPFKLTAGQDITDETLWERTGTIVMSGSHIELDGTLVSLDARPFVFPFKAAWTSIIPDLGTSYEFGFQDDLGNWIVSVSSADFPLALDSGDDQHTYEIFTNPVGDSGTIEFWGVHLHQNFTVDVDVTISTVSAANYDTNVLTLGSAWSVDNNYVRIRRAGEDIGSARILRWNGSKTQLTLTEIPAGVLPGDEVTRGVGADSIQTIELIKTVTPAGGGYGLPAISGLGVHLGAFIIQRTGQVEGYLLKEFNSMPPQVYPRALSLDVDQLESSDGVVSGSGSSSNVTFSQKFSTDKQIHLIFNYVKGGKHDFESICGASGAHVTVPIDGEQDPTKLQAIADRICDLGSRNIPRVTSDMHSTEIAGNPLPWDPLPLDLPAHYQVSVPSVPMISNTITYKGFKDLADDVVLFDMDAGDKTPTERAQQEALRGNPLSKFPIRLATIGGARITGVSWDDVTLSASISGGGTVFGPHGQVVNLAGGIDPATEAGVADKHRNPVTLRCTTDGGNFQKDVLTFTVIYPPAAVNPDTVTCKYNSQNNTLKFKWPRASGAVAYDIMHLIEAPTPPGGITDSESIVDPDGCMGAEASGLLWERVARTTSPEYLLPYEPLSRAIKIRSVGLCDKVSPYIEACCVLPPLPAPTTFDVRKVKKQDRIVFRVSAPDQTAAFKGRAEFLRILVLQTTDPDLVITDREDFVDTDPNVTIWTLPLASKDELTHYKISFDDTAADDIVWVTACWVDRFHDEGLFTEPFDATQPPMSPPSLVLGDFFQSASQANGGTVVDDDNTTTIVEFTGKFRVHLGRHNETLQLVFHKSERTTSYASVGTWPYLTGGEYNRLRSHWTDVTDEDVANGYIDIDMPQDFKDSKKKHFTYRPYKIKVRGPAVRERIDPALEEVFTKEVLTVWGFAPDLPVLPIVPHEVDAVFDMVPFYFHPGVTGFGHDTPVVANLKVKAQESGVKVRWKPINDSNIWRYFVFFSLSNFGVRGPGDYAPLSLTGDPAIAAALDAIDGDGDITLYNQANTVKNVAAVAIDMGKVKGHRFYNGETYGSLTLTQGVTYFVGVIAQTKSGRFSAVISDTDTDLSGGPGGASVPGALAFPGSIATNTVDGDPDKNLARIEVVVATANAGTFVANNIAEVGVFVVERNDNNTLNVGSHHFFSRSTAFATSSVPIEFFLKIGRKFQITDVIAMNGDKRTTTSGTINFTAGAIRGVDTGDAKVVPAPTFGAITRLDGSNKEDDVPVTLTQDGVDIVWFKQLVLEKSTNGGAFKFETSINLKHEDTLYLSASATKTWNFAVKRKAAVTAQYRVFAVAVGGKSSTITVSGSQSATPVDTSALPGQLTFPTSLNANTVDGDPDKNLARIEVVLSTLNGLGFDVNNIREFGVYVIERDEANLNNVAQPFLFTRTSLSSPLTSIAMEFYLRMGRRFRILQAVSLNGDRENGTAGILDFVAGGVRHVNTGDSKVVPPPVFQAGPTANGNKNVSVTVRVNQDATEIIIFKKLLIEKSMGGGPFEIETSIGLKEEDALYTAVSVSKDFVFDFKRKPGVAVQFRATVIAVGGKASSVVTSSSLSASVSDQSEDPVAVAAVGGLNLTFSNRKGFKSIWTKPTLNTDGSTTKSLIGYKIAYFNDTAGTVWMDAETGQVAANQAAATIFRADNHHTTNLKKSQLASPFSVSGCKVIIIPVNIVAGVETNGTSATSTLIPPGDPDGLEEDASFPDQPPTPNVVEYAGSVIVTAGQPANNFQTIKRYQNVESKSVSPPTSAQQADPPTGPDVLLVDTSRAGVTQFRQPRQEKSRWYFTRVLNKNGWSIFSPPGSIGQTSRPLEDVIGTGVPQLVRPGTAPYPADPLAPNGFINVQGTVLSGFKVGVHVWADSSDGINTDIAVIEIIMPTDQNAMSIQLVQMESWRATAVGVKKDTQVIKPGLSCVFRTRIVSSQYVARYRIQNMWRGTTISPSPGWSVFSDYFLLPTSAAAVNYDPGANLPPENDFQNLPSYPDRYIPL